MASYKCQKCQKVLDEINFYTYKDGRKTELCKKCLTMHIDNFDESTFLWILEKMDVPYIPAEWNNLRDKAYAKDPDKMNGMSVIGKYLSKMKLKQWKQYGWADSQKLQEEADAKLGEKAAIEKKDEAEFEEELKNKLEAGEITESEYKTLVSTPTQAKVTYEKAAESAGTGEFVGNPMKQGMSLYDEKQFFPEEELPDTTAKLTQDDKVYLAVKWGCMYKPSEWIELEKMYVDMTNSFDIQDADSKNTLVLLCKTTLKANQAIDCGDIESFQKLSKVQESLRKTAKFTAAQNKEQKTDFIDSIGELTALCEKEGGFIPRFKTDIPQDKVDLTLKDMNSYIYKLVTQDLGFGQQIEDALKKIQIQKEMNEEASKHQEEYELNDEDFKDFYNNVQEQKETDQEHYYENKGE